MKAIEGIRRSGVGVEPARTLRDVAGIMEQSGLGTLAIVEGDRLVGIVTDRDLVRRGMARGLAPDARIDSVMSTPVITIDAEADLHDAFAIFRTNPVRRLAVVRDGAFVGMLSVNDLLIDLTSDLADLARPVTAGTVFAHRDSPLPAPT